MKTFYSMVLSVALLAVLGVGAASAQTTPEPTTAELQSMIRQLQGQIMSLQAQVDEGQADKGEQTQEEATESEGDNSEDSQVTIEDTISNTPAPGMVRVLAEINTCDLQAETPTCELNIQEVLAYGMSSPTLSAGTTLAVAVAGQSGAELQSSDTQFEMTLNSLLPRPSSVEGPEWELREVEKSEPEAETDDGNDSLSEQATEKARITRHLDQGDRGPNVRKLQELLAANNEIYPEGLVTGYYGPLTAQAVSRLQQRSGLPAVGRVGPRTLNQVNSVSKSESENLRRARGVITEVENKWTYADGSTDIKVRATGGKVTNVSVPSGESTCTVEVDRQILSEGVMVEVAGKSPYDEEIFVCESGKHYLRSIDNENRQSG